MLNPPASLPESGLRIDQPGVGTTAKGSKVAHHYKDVKVERVATFGYTLLHSIYSEFNIQSMSNFGTTSATMGHVHLDQETQRDRGCKKRQNDLSDVERSHQKMSKGLFCACPESVLNQHRRATEAQAQ